MRRSTEPNTGTDVVALAKCCKECGNAQWGRCIQAQALYVARRDRTPIVPFTDADASLGLDDGYEIQQELVKLLVHDGDRVIGHKVGATSAAMQRLIGIDTPDYGPVLASTLYRPDEPIALSRFISPKIEAEIVFVLGDELIGPNVTYDQARRAIASMAASMEIVDSRIAQWRIRLADTVADLASNGGLVVSDNRVAADGVDARSIRMVLRRNGEDIASGVGADALGDPVAVVVWLANMLGRNGIALEPCHLIMTGALHAAVPMHAGDVFEAQFDHLGSIQVTVTDRPVPEQAHRRRPRKHSTGEAQYDRHTIRDSCHRRAR